MERFVQLVVAGGVALVAGLWVLALLESWPIRWLLGGALAVLGGGAVLAGIGVEIEVP